MYCISIAKEVKISVSSREFPSREFPGISRTFHFPFPGKLDRDPGKFYLIAYTISVSIFPNFFHILFLSNQEKTLQTAWETFTKV